MAPAKDLLFWKVGDFLTRLKYVHLSTSASLCNHFCEGKKAWDNIVLFWNHSETLFVTKGSSGKRDSGLVFGPCRGQEWPG